ncbi:hypothetical protein E4T42_04458 [Aureobasidium subglaciale]|nr:hypothetical protein E4T42_04458 [Aureobasidium subglaciale]
MCNHFPSATYAELVDDDHNMLVQAKYPQQQREFVDYLQRETLALKQAVAHHLSLPSEELCSVEHLKAWTGGSFNVLIPVVVNNSYRVAVRCPWPHHTQSLTSPNMADEKIRGEATAYVWMSKYCSSVPIPQLIGFGLSNGRSFTPVSIRERLHCVFFDVQYWRPFVLSSSPVHFKTGYRITSFIEPRQGKMLMERWPSHDPVHRQNLFRSLSKIILDVARVPQTRIGSFTLNAVEDDDDAEGQLATIVVWRAIRSHFTDPSLRRGPFAMQLTDLNEGNIFVDNDYNITAVVDLEWTCSLPLEMLQPPFWVSGHIQDSFVGATEKTAINEKFFMPACHEFFDILSQEQASRHPLQKPAFDVANVARVGFEKKSHWYFAGLRYPRVAYSFLLGHIQPLFAASAGFPGQVEIAPYYTKNVSLFIDQRVREKAEYDEALHRMVM